MKKVFRASEEYNTGKLGFIELSGVVVFKAFSSGRRWIAEGKTDEVSKVQMKQDTTKTFLLF